MSIPKKEDLPNIFITKNLRRLIRLSDYSGASLGRRLGVTTGTVSGWQNGVSYPKLPQLIMLADIFDVDLGDLIRKDLFEQPQSMTKEHTSKYGENESEITQLRAQISKNNEEMSVILKELLERLARLEGND